MSAPRCAQWVRGGRRRPPGMGRCSAPPDVPAGPEGRRGHRPSLTHRYGSFGSSPRRPQLDRAQSESSPCLDQSSVGAGMPGRRLEQGLDQYGRASNNVGFLDGRPQRVLVQKNGGRRSEPNFSIISSGIPPRSRLYRPGVSRLSHRGRFRVGARRACSSPTPSSEAFVSEPTPSIPRSPLTDHPHSPGMLGDSHEHEVQCPPRLVVESSLVIIPNPHDAPEVDRD